MKSYRIFSRTFIPIVVGMFFCVLMVSCKTFKTYYGNTFQEVDNEKIKRTFRLDLSNQNLTELPEKVVDLKELRMINLSGNTQLHLEKTFEILSGLPKLEVILLDSLNLTELPENFKNLRTLKHVSLVNNPKLNFSHAFELMHTFDLEFLNLSHNKLTELPDEISEISRLRDLKLSYNHIQLSALFLTLADLPKLRSLWLDNNRIETLPPEIAAIRRVVYFYIDDNELSEFPKEMSQMDRLLVMHAALNNFSELPVELTHMPHLMFAILSNNPIETIPPEFRKRDYSLLALVMDGNKLDEAEKIFAKKMFRRFFIFSARSIELFLKDKIVHKKIIADGNFFFRNEFETHFFIKTSGNIVFIHIQNQGGIFVEQRLLGCEVDKFCTQTQTLFVRQNIQFMNLGFL